MNVGQIDVNDNVLQGSVIPDLRNMSLGDLFVVSVECVLTKIMVMQMFNPVKLHSSFDLYIMILKVEAQHSGLMGYICSEVERNSKFESSS